MNEGEALVFSFRSVCLEVSDVFLKVYSEVYVQGGCFPTMIRLVSESKQGIPNLKRET